MFECTLYKTKSEKTALHKVMETGSKAYEGVLINNSNVVDPSIRLHVGADVIAKYNYMVINDFGRKYFITDITALTKDTCMVSGHVDVLSTYEEDIRKNSGVIRRATNMSHKYIDDNIIKVDSRPNIVTQVFKNGGYFTDNPSICLVVVQ